jgi:hypothetical protein
MDTKMPAWLAGHDQIVRARLESLRAEARDERLARAARAARSSSRRLTKGLSIVVRQAGVRTIGGTDR